MLTDDPNLLTVWLNVLYLLSRYVHIVAAMLLVGGFLFYEMVMPAAISDLQEPAQLAVYARARWFFRRIIYTSIVAMIASGVYMTVWRMQTYISTEFLPVTGTLASPESIPWSLRTGWWWAAHVVSAGFAILVALHVLVGDRPLRYPVSWLRLDLMLLLIVIFFATVTRQVDQIHQERNKALLNPMYLPYIRVVPNFPLPGVEEEVSQTQPIQETPAAEDK